MAYPQPLPKGGGREDGLAELDRLVELVKLEILEKLEKKLEKMKRINIILKSSFLPSFREGLGVGFLLLASCTGNPGSLADVAEDDSLFIDTVATLDEQMAPDTITLPDSLTKDSL